MKKFLLSLSFIAIFLSGFSQTNIFGCMDPGAINFNPEATIDDGSCCSADNFLYVAMDVPDPSFAYFLVYGANGGNYYQLNNAQGICIPDGCYDVEFHYDADEFLQFTASITDANGLVIASGLLSSAENPDLSFSINPIMGCMASNACNFDPNANCHDYTLCDYGCWGCTNANANNYDPNATIDDGSCCVTTYTIVSDNPLYWSISSNSSDYSTYGNYPENNSFCIDQGCYHFYGGNPDGSDTPLQWQILDANGNVAYTGISDINTGGYILISNGVISGCTDPNACNYNDNANCLDYGSCDYQCWGCTDPNAGNFNPNATQDDGSCCTDNWFVIEMNTPGGWYAYDNDFFYASDHYPEMNGFCGGNGCFTFVFYPDDLSNTAEGTLSLNGVVISPIQMNDSFQEIIIFIDNAAIAGCIDPNACNYDPLANCDDMYSCDYGCYGCTDSTAPNYNPASTMDDGTCCYNSWFTLELSSPASWSASSGNDYTYGNYPQQNGFCASDNCFSFYSWSYDGSPLVYHIYDEQGNLVATGTSEYFGNNITISLSNELIGCTNSDACNYDPLATCNDSYLCDYSCYGCMDPNAPNYDPEVTIDNGTCCTENWYVLNFSTPVYWEAININWEGASGSFPYQNGFCMVDGCFALYVYSYEQTMIDYSIQDAYGNVIQSGTVPPYSYVPISVSIGNDVAGCLDPNLCNYNPDANCDDGSCDYFCEGCTDELALNYNPTALYDDGSCFFNVVSPNLGMTMIPDEANDQFYILSSMMDEGNGAPYLLRSDYDEQITYMNQSGQYLSGPYPCDQSIAFTLQSLQAGLETYLTTSIDGACAIVNHVKDEISTSKLSLFPNPNNGTFVISNISASRAQIRISDMSGRVVMDEMRNIANGSYEMNSDQLTNGVYQVSVITEGNASTVKMIVRK